MHKLGQPADGHPMRLGNKLGLHDRVLYRMTSWHMALYRWGHNVGDRWRKAPTFFPYLL